MVFAPSFYKRLQEVSSETGMKPEDILVVMAAESGFDPSAHHEKSHASGLIQFMPDTLGKLGFKGTSADFRDLGAEKQLDYVEAFIKKLTSINGGPLTSAVQYRIGNWIPLALQIPGVKNHKRDTIIAAKNPKTPHIPHVDVEQEARYYNANHVLDLDKDGNISYGDIEDGINKRVQGKDYRQVLAEMQKATGYTPGSIPESAVAVSKPTIKQPSTFLARVEEIAKRLLPSVFASEKQSKKIYKQYLPVNHLVIQVQANDYTDAIEFSRVLCSALEEELLATAGTYTDGKTVEVFCEINGPEKICFATVKQLTSSLQDMFKLATNKIGGIDIKTDFAMNKKSVYQPLSFVSADIQYRKFLLKFV